MLDRSLSCAALLIPGARGPPAPSSRFRTIAPDLASHWEPRFARCLDSVTLAADRPKQGGNSVNSVVRSKESQTEAGDIPWSPWSQWELPPWTSLGSVLPGLCRPLPAPARHPGLEARFPKEESRISHGRSGLGALVNTRPVDCSGVQTAERPARDRLVHLLFTVGNQGSWLRPVQP